MCYLDNFPYALSPVEEDQYSHGPIVYVFSGRSRPLFPSFMYPQRPFSFKVWLQSLALSSFVVAVDISDPIVS